MAMAASKGRKRAGQEAGPGKSKWKKKDEKAKKSRRGPGAYLEPITKKGDDGTQIDDDVVQTANDMVGDGHDSDEDDDHPKPNEEGPSNGAPAYDFLLGLNEKQVSQTRAEVKRIHREEVAQHTAEKRTLKKRNGKGKKVAVYDEQGDSQEEAELSGSESTDMEGASIASDDDSDDEKVAELGSDEESAHMEKLQRARKRIQRQEEEEQQSKKRKRLPTRGDEGWSSGEEQSESESENAAESDVDEHEKADAAEAPRKSRAVHEPLAEDTSDEEDAERAYVIAARKAERLASRSTITTGTRFGLRSPFEIFLQKKRTDRVRMAREQIARLSTDILNDPEVSLGLIKRLATFADAKVTSPEDRDKTAVVDEAARASAILSLCAVFIDILPGFRIRALTEKEMEERVNQELARRREWEQGLVAVYGGYLEMCERISRQTTGQQLFDVTLKAMCTLAVKATHFNYRTNLLRSLVACLSRKAWDKSSEEANEALITVLKQDRHGDVSLEVVRLVNRMIKERQFHVDARVLNMLRYLRLRDELPQGKRATMTKASDLAKEMTNDVYNKKLKAKDIRKGKGEHLSKKDAKRRKEMREIEDELKEAEAEVDKEERERHQTETLKLLFVLYFSVIKAERTSDALLIATLKGLSLFAHRINIDFFRDLLAVIRGHVRRCMNGVEVTQKKSESDDSNATRPAPILALHCIVTALELLNGQGEALNVDMSDIVADLYTLMIPLCMQPDLEQSTGTSGRGDDESHAQLLLRALHLSLVMPPVLSVSRERLASFAARMCLCALHSPVKTTLALVQTVHILLRRQPALQSLLEGGEDRARNGHFDAANDHVEGLRPLQAGCVLWPLTVLRNSCHDDVRVKAEALLAEV